MTFLANVYVSFTFFLAMPENWKRISVTYGGENTFVSIGIYSDIVINYLILVSYAHLFGLLIIKRNPSEITMREQSTRYEIWL